MRFRFTTFIVFVFALSSFAQKTEKKFSVGQKAEMLIGVLNNNHCQAQKIDDAYSKVLFNDLIEGLNAEKSTFTSADIKTLSKYETLLDDQIKSKNISFIPELMKVFKSRAMSLDTLITKICERPINFETKFTFVPKYDSVATSDSELKVRLQRNLKYSIFENLYYNLLDTTSYKLSKEYLDYPKLKIQEAASREKIKLRYKNAIKRSLDYINEENLENYFLNTIAQTYDNHTEFFDIKAAENYVNSTNPNDEVFGFSFGQNKKAEVIIGDILPGGPAWNSGLINIGDLVLNITFDNKKSVNVLGNDLMEIETIFEDNETPKISLTLRKSTNEIVKVDLVKEHVVNEEETVRSLILENKANFGYINLPAFYSDNESDNTSGCANNVARELIKMREDNIKGLILDLRFNGGGSVNEALDLAGIFIDQGIFGAGKPGKGKSILLKDPNRGSIYDGPLIVLINQASASASEILAGILQDYNRAVIVGSKSYGKGVAQIVVPLDSLSKEPMFYAKTTVWRVFRPSGKAIQHEGVKPDINLPSILDYSEFSEKTNPKSLKPVDIDRNIPFSPLPSLPIAAISQKSKARLDQNQHFSKVEDMSNKLKKYMFKEEESTEFTWEIFCKNRIEKEILIENILKNEENNLGSIKVSTPKLDNIRSKTDLVWNSLNEKLFNRIAKDIYIQESLNILLNLTE